MRKIVFLAVFASMVSAAVAQDNMMNKRGNPILPEAGDYSIGIDAVPFIDWAFDKTRVQSSFGVSSAGNAVSAQMPMTFVGLYMKDANTAYRGKVGINFNSHSTDHLVSVNNDSTEGSSHQVTDNIKTSGFGITLGAGIQKSRGKGRLHGIYGAEAMIGFGSGTKTTYSYGNNWILDANHTNGTSTVNPFVAPGQSNHIDAAGNNEVVNTSRVTEQKNGGSFGFGIDGFVGVEYFLLAKMSVSAEYNWGIMLSSSGEGSTTTESTVAPTGTSTTYTLRTTESKSGKSSDFNVGNGDINSSSTGSIVFHFYF
jgi:hypothetical protein